MKNKLKKNINLLDLNDKYKICRLIDFLGYELKQGSNGAYINMKEITNKDLSIIYTEVNKLLK